MQNAAVIAQHLKDAWGQGAVEHVSTALTPEDRTPLADARRRLNATKYVQNLIRDLRAL